MHDRNGPSVPLRVVVADDHPAFRGTLAGVIATEPRLEVVAEAADLRAARSAVVRHGAAALVVDTGLLDQNRGVLGPLPAGTTVIVVGMDVSPRMADRARRQGADGYVVKDVAHTALVSELLRHHGT